MKTQYSAGMAKQRRRRLMLDRRVICTVAVSLAVVGFSLTAAAVALTSLLPGERFFAGLNGEESRFLFLGALLFQLALVLLIDALLALVMIHRFKGPSMVFCRALSAIRSGDFGARVTLRRSDFLQDVSAEIGQLQTHLAEDRDRQSDEASAALDAMRLGDASLACEFLESRLLADAPQLESLPGRAHVVR